jgi:hypothetical protein
MSAPETLSPMVAWRLVATAPWWCDPTIGALFARLPRRVVVVVVVTVVVGLVRARNLLMMPGLRAVVVR